jgi:predicted phosphodiesterase
MRIAYMSDLHLEFEAARARLAGWPRLDAARRQLPGHPDRGPFLGHLDAVDLVVLAGDIDKGTRGIAYADAVARFLEVPVVYVAGNHESYDGDLTTMPEALQAAAWATDGRVFYLEQGTASLWVGSERVHVLGCTLWTDYMIEGDAGTAMQRAQSNMNDFQHITWRGTAFRPEDAQAIHRRCRTWLGEQIDRIRMREPGSRVLIVSHHAPVAVALEPRVAGLAPCYVSDLDREIAAWRPDAWFHGHSHRPHVTRCHDTWIVSAPLGYPTRDGSDESYRPGLIEV